MTETATILVNDSGLLQKTEVKVLSRKGCLFVNLDPKRRGWNLSHESGVCLFRFSRAKEAQRAMEILHDLPELGEITPEDIELTREIQKNPIPHLAAAYLSGKPLNPRIEFMARMQEKAIKLLEENSVKTA